MIELELKHEIKSIPKVLGELDIIKEKDQVDIYYDTHNYDLLRNGNFLRIRNDKRLEFKLYAGDDSHLFCQETDFDLDKLSNNKDKINNILTRIGLKTLDNLTSFKQIIDSNGLIVLSPIIKHRTSYKYDDNITISVDKVDNLGIYMESEIMIDKNDLSSNEADKIKEELVSSLKKASILTGKEKSVNIGYVELYLLKYNIEVYNLGKYKA